MAEDGGDRDQQQQQPAAAEGRGRESVKLFVGQVPKQLSEPELAAMFGRVALVDEVTVIRDRATRVSRGNDGSVRLPSGLGLRPRDPFARAANAAPAPGGFSWPGIWAAGNGWGPVRTSPSVFGRVSLLSGGSRLGSELGPGGNAAAELQLFCSRMLRRGRKVSCFAGNCLLDCPPYAMRWGILVPFALEWIGGTLVLCGALEGCDERGANSMRSLTVVDM